jgi:hypothetical protein
MRAFSFRVRLSMWCGHLDLGMIICTKLQTVILRHLQQIAVKFVVILKCERELLLLSLLYVRHYKSCYRHVCH